MNRLVTPALSFGLVLLLTSPLLAQPSPRQLGPFQLGMKTAQFKAAATQAGLQTPRRQVPQERDLMGLGLIEVRPMTSESRAAEPEADKIWQVTAYFIADRVAYLSLDYGTEDPARAERWYKRYAAPVNATRELIDTSWSLGGVVLHADRFGRTLHAVDWDGLRRSNRVLVTIQGAVTVANQYFRRLRALQAEATLDLLRRRVIEYYRRPAKAGGGFACAVPPSVDLTPAESPCGFPGKRFPAAHDTWNQRTWGLLGIRPGDVAPDYAYRIDSSGRGSSARVSLVAVGDLDCDGKVATVRVRLRAVPSRGHMDCTLDDGEWDVIDPLE